MKKFAVLNLVLVLSLLLGTAALAQEGDFGVVQRTADAALDGWSPVISADALYDLLNDGDPDNNPFVVSVRSAEHYALGHIPGAINIPWKEIADPANLALLPTDQPIVVYCYTGHTGQVAATMLNLLGYNVQNLKFGMMGWSKNPDVVVVTPFGPDTDQRDYPLETEANLATVEYAYPELETGADEPEEIVRMAAEMALADWSPTISADALFENLNDGDTSNDPVIVSVRSEESYGLGHIEGAINIPWNKIADPANLALLPADAPIVVYCYTGHTGQVAATVLKTLGYDVQNLKYGMMGWTEDDEVLGTSRYDLATAPDYAVEGTAAVDTETETETEEPETLPVDGGVPFPVEGILLGFGTLTAAAGVYLRRRKAA